MKFHSHSGTGKSAHKRTVRAWYMTSTETAYGFISGTLSASVCSLLRPMCAQTTRTIAKYARFKCTRSYWPCAPRYAMHVRMRYGNVEAVDDPWMAKTVCQLHSRHPIAVITFPRGELAPIVIASVTISRPLNFDRQLYVIWRFQRSNQTRFWQITLTVCSTFASHTWVRVYDWMPPIHVATGMRRSMLLCNIPHSIEEAPCLSVYDVMCRQIMKRIAFIMSVHPWRIHIHTLYTWTC